jgi:dTDP-4-amino-4,6-dideoxygalactose transaminase
MEEIRFFDLRQQYALLAPELEEMLRRVLEKGSFILGDEVERFETEFAGYCEVSHAVGVASGTDALQLALRACEIGAGDEVLVPSHTAVGTIAAIELTGARPVFVDIDPQRYTLDPDALERASTPLTRAIIPVHLYGCPAEMQPILDFARQNDLWVIEDCAQSHGALYRGCKTGSLGNVAAFSFYPTKNLGAYGDGGMVVTNDESLAEKVRLLRQYGWKERFVSHVRGLNSRLDELQAAILRVKLKYLDEWNERRRNLAQLYLHRLSAAGLELPVPPLEDRHVFHQFVVRHPQRDALRRYLKEKGVQTAVHFPLPVHLQPAYANLGSAAGSLPVTEKIAGEILSLPMYPELSEAQVEFIAQCIVNFRG